MSFMLHKLHEAEEELPELLKDWSSWSGLDITYHEPRVERVWRQWGNYRISLHVIHPALKVDCLYHPHPWASAIRIVHGGYEMGIGYGQGFEPPEEACKIILTTGSEYSMENKDGWHYVRPINNASLSIMVSGQPWGREMPIEPDDAINQKMPIARLAEILNIFSLFYPEKEGSK